MNVKPRVRKTADHRPQTTEDQRYEDEMRDFERNVIGTQEAADLLGVTQDHVEALIRHEKIRAKKIGPKYYAVYRPSLVKYSKSKTRKGKPPSNKPKLEQ